MLYLLVLLFFIVFTAYFKRRWAVLSQEQRKELIKKFLIWGSLGFILVAVLMGRASWIMGVIAALIAILSRLTQLMVYFPFIKKLFPNAGAASSSSPARSTSQMSRHDAAEILGVSIDATEEEVRLAHKRLMQKMHPDRGGSEALAKQINQAKDVMLA